MFADVSMNFNFLTAQPSDIARIPNKNIAPYENYTLYLNNPGVSFQPTLNTEYEIVTQYHLLKQNYKTLRIKYLPMR